jgi:FixJ family two-component response regulator
MPDEFQRTVFIIDDDASVRKALARLLRSAGYRVEVFVSGEQFLEETHSHEHGCILLDHQMPGIGGIALQKKLTQASCWTPIIIITAHGDEATRMQTMHAGAACFLTKPIDDRELVRAVETALEKGELARHPR